MKNLKNKNAKKCFSLMKEKEGKKAKIYIYDEISWFGDNAKDFAQGLSELGDLDEIELHLNSPGGDVFDGLAIYQTLVDHKAKVAVHVDGWAASIASIIMLAADERLISESGFVTIHSPWTMVVGNADDLMEQATLLEKIGEQLKQVYVRATGKDEEEVKRWMTGETWFNAQEALDAGLVTGIKDSVKAAASMIKDFDTSAFKHTPKSFLQLVEEPEEPITTPEPEAPKVILTPLRNYWEQRIGASHYSRNTK